MPFTFITVHITYSHKTHLKGITEEPLCILKKRGMVSGQVMLLYSSYSSFTRAVSVGDVRTMEVISLISVLLLWLVILLMFISEKSHGLCLTASVSLSHFLSAGCSLFSLLHFISMQLCHLHVVFSLSDTCTHRKPKKGITQTCRNVSCCCLNFTMSRKCRFHQ